MIKLSKKNLEYTSSANESTIPRSVTLLAEQMQKIHWNIRVAKESSGYIIYLPSPELLLLDGRKELVSKHLALVCSRVDPKNRSLNPKIKYNPQNAATCMKTGKHYSFDMLSKMAPMNRRGYKWLVSRKDYNITYADTSKSLIEDEDGNMVPDDPGDCVPVTELPDDHPCLFFIRSRGYDPVELFSQFRASFCEKEAPEDEAKGRFYSRLPYGFKDTPQGRLILFMDIKGVQVGWQARILECKDEDGDTLFYHPYNKKWEVVKSMGDWLGNEDDIIKWKKLAKYKSAFGLKRAEVLMGIDAAVKHNTITGNGRHCYLVEGPLDAATLGPPAIAMLGKHLSDRQVDTIRRSFDYVTFIPDNDKAGAETETKVMRALISKMRAVRKYKIPNKYKDLGEIPIPVARTEIIKEINKLWNK
jgi:hypothetical protein